MALTGSLLVTRGFGCGGGVRRLMARGSGGGGAGGGGGRLSGTGIGPDLPGIRSRANRSGLLFEDAGTGGAAVWAVLWVAAGATVGGMIGDARGTVMSKSSSASVAATGGGVEANNRRRSSAAEMEPGD